MRALLALLLAAPSLAQTSQPRLASRIAFLKADGTLLRPPTRVGAGFDGAVTSLVVQADGKILALGEFASYDGRMGLHGLARLRADLSLDELFARRASKPLSKLGRYDAALVQADGRILLSGFFTTYGGHKANGIVRLTASGGMDPAFLRATDSLHIGESAVRVRSMA